MQIAALNWAAFCLPCTQAAAEAAARKGLYALTHQRSDFRGT